MCTNECLGCYNIREKTEKAVQKQTGTFSGVKMRERLKNCGYERSSARETKESGRGRNGVKAKKLRVVPHMATVGLCRGGISTALWLGVCREVLILREFQLF